MSWMWLSTDTARFACELFISAVAAPGEGAMAGEELGGCADAPVMRNADVSAAVIVFMRLFLRDDGWCGTGASVAGQLHWPRRPSRKPTSSPTAAVMPIARQGRSRTWPSATLAALRARAEIARGIRSANALAAATRA